MQVLNALVHTGPEWFGPSLSQIVKARMTEVLGEEKREGGCMQALKPLIVAVV